MVNRVLNLKAWAIVLTWLVPMCIAMQFSWAVAFGLVLPCALVIDHFLAPLRVEAD